MQAKKVSEHKREKERKREERELKERQERIRRAQEEHEKRRKEVISQKLQGSHQQGKSGNRNMFGKSGKVREL